jgi:hypothetical protein
VPIGQFEADLEGLKHVEDVGRMGVELLGVSENRRPMAADDVRTTDMRTSSMGWRRSTRAHRL